MDTKTRTTTAGDLRDGDRITASGTAVEGRVVADVTEKYDPRLGVWVEVTFTDGSTWPLDGWDAPVTVFA